MDPVSPARRRSATARPGRRASRQESNLTDPEIRDAVIYMVTRSIAP